VEFNPYGLTTISYFHNKRSYNKTTGFVDEGELCMLDQGLVFIL